MSETYFNDTVVGAGWPDIRALMPTDPVLGGLDGVSNAPAKGLMQRTNYLRAGVDALATEVGAVADQIDLLAAADGPALEDALRALLEERWPWRYYEVFSTGWTLIQTPDRQPLPVTILTTPVPGDDSLDVTTTTTLRAGSGYIVWDTAGRQEVTVTEILTATRIRIAPALAIPLAAGAQIAQTDWAVAPRSATAQPGSAYYARPVDLGPAAGQRAIVVRTAPTAATLRAWWRPSGGSWAECVWSWRRSGTDYAGQDWQEIEYILPASGLAQVRITIDPDTPEASIDPVTIRRITILEGPTNLGGIGNGPLQPAALSPAAGATGIGPAPALTLSACVSPTGSGQAALEIELYQGATLLLATGPIAGGSAAYSLAAGLLLPAASYAWRGRYVDGNGVPSEWSPLAAFSTMATFAAILRPVGLSPAGGAIGVALTPTLTAAPFAVGAGSDTHDGSQWQVSAAPDFSTLVHDSGTVTDLTSHALTSSLGVLTAYFWRVRYHGAALGWSDWSTPIQFTTLAPSGSAVFAAPGTYSFVVPAGVTRLTRIDVTGGGGGTGQPSANSAEGYNRAGAGGGGYRYATNVTVAPGDIITVIVGAGGGVGQPGGSSSVGAWVTAFGGSPSYSNGAFDKGGGGGAGALAGGIAGGGHPGGDGGDGDISAPAYYQWGAGGEPADATGPGDDGVSSTSGYVPTPSISGHGANGTGPGSGGQIGQPGRVNIQW